MIAKFNFISLKIISRTFFLGFTYQKSLGIGPGQVCCGRYHSPSLSIRKQRRKIGDESDKRAPQSVFSVDHGLWGPSGMSMVALFPVALCFLCD